MAVVGKHTVRIAGHRALIREGQVYEDTDPVVEARPDLFESPEEYQRRKARPQSTAELGQLSMSARRRPQGVETARSAPGESRVIDYPCPDCGERFTSERAVKTHVKKAHG